VDGNFVVNVNSSGSGTLRRLDDGSTVPIDSTIVTDYYEAKALVDPTAQLAATVSPFPTPTIGVHDLATGTTVLVGPWSSNSHPLAWSPDHKTVLAVACGDSFCRLADPYIVHLDSGTTNSPGALLRVALTADGGLVSGSGSGTSGAQVDIFDRNFTLLRSVNPGPLTFTSVIPAR